MIYFKEKDQLRRFEIERDLEPWSPREEMDNVGTMLLYWNRYSLGDVHFLNSYEIIDYLKDMVYEKVPFSKIIAFADEKEIARQLVGDDYEIAYDIIYCGGITSVGSLITILEKYADMVILPVYAYEHSGLTISCDYGYPYSDRWDGGQAGFILTDKDTVENSFNSKEDWKETAINALKDEVDLYNMYLCGDCYGFITYDEDDNLIDSCWGFYSDKFGEELEEELFVTTYGNVPFTRKKEGEI